MKMSKHKKNKESINKVKNENQCELEGEITEEGNIEDTAVENQEKIIDFMEGKEKLENQLSELDIARKEIEDLKNTVQRTQADFINYKRRTEEEKNKLSIFANEKLIIELLSVIDNFDRALGHPGETDKSFVEGVELIKKQILDLLAKNSVREIPTDIDFDPNFHYAVMQEEADESGKILEVFQKGYMLDEKVIRPSMVKVSK